MADKYFKKAFDIGDLPENIDLDSPPVTGFDYLYRVRLETRKCPKVVVSNIDTSKFIPRQNVEVDFSSGFIRASPGFEPDLKWQEQHLKLFSKYRDQLLSHRDVLKSKFPKREFPKLGRQEDWCLYSLGRVKYEEIYHDTIEKDSDDGCPSKNKKSRYSGKGTPPLLSVLLYLTQNHVIKLLTYHVEWLEKTNFTHEHGEWLYALLACLEKPLDPDTCALLRCLSRVCSGLRSRLTNTLDDTLKPLNSVITIISHCFDQKDMSDTFLDNEAHSK